jgi:creatinine amidohydrolase
LNTGVSTLRALEPARSELARSGILFSYTDLLSALGPTEASLREQEGGSHADEIETSMMLVLAPERVSMERAVKDYHPGTGPLTRDPAGPGTYSPTGAWGDPTLATVAKGERLVEALVVAMVADLARLTREIPPRIVQSPS